MGEREGGGGCSRNGVEEGGESDNENNDPNNGSREQPSGVETQPREVDTNLFTKVAPGYNNKQTNKQTNNNYQVYTTTTTKQQGHLMWSRGCCLYQFLGWDQRW